MAARKSIFKLSRNGLKKRIEGRDVFNDQVSTFSKNIYRSPSNLLNQTQVFEETLEELSFYNSESHEMLEIPENTVTIKSSYDEYL